MNENVLGWFEEWCISEYSEKNGPIGFEVSTLDNPGYHIVIYLNGSSLEGKPFENKELDNGDNDWYECSVQDWSSSPDYRGQTRIYTANGSLNRLRTMLSIFREYAES